VISIQNDSVKKKQKSVKITITATELSAQNATSPPICASPQNEGKYRAKR
jgi:hypothetical protein